MRRGVRKAKSEMGAVFFVTVGISLAFILWGVFYSQSLISTAAATFRFVVRDLSWFYLIPTNLFLIFVFYLAFSKYARMSAKGILNPSAATKLTWGVVMAAFAAVLLYIGGFEALLQASVLAGVPFTVIMVLMCWSLYKAMREDAGGESHQEEPRGERDRAEEPAGQPVPNPGK